MSKNESSKTSSYAKIPSPVLFVISYNLITNSLTNAAH